MKQIIHATLEDGVKEACALLHDWLLILTAQYNKCKGTTRTLAFGFMTNMNTSRQAGQAHLIDRQMVVDIHGLVMDRWGQPQGRWVHGLLCTAINKQTNKQTMDNP